MPETWEPLTAEQMEELYGPKDGSTSDVIKIQVPEMTEEEIEERKREDMAEELYRIFISKVASMDHIISAGLSFESTKFKVEILKGHYEETRNFVLDEIRRRGMGEHYMERLDIVEHTKRPQIKRQ